MENKILFTFKIIDAEKLSPERIGFIAQEIASKKIEEENYGPYYNLELRDSISLKDGSKEYEFIVYYSTGDSNEAEDQDLIYSDRGNGGLAASP
jgi:hypothetical protein